MTDIWKPRKSSGRRTRTSSGTRLAVLASVVSLVVACGADAPSQDDDPAADVEQVLTYGIGAGIGLNFDPVKITVVTLPYAIPVFDSLMRLNTDGTVTPQLAKELTTSDSKVWTLELRPDVKFHDGTPLDADAVVYNMQRHLDPANASSARTLLSDVQSVVATDDLTVTFTLAAPRGSFEVTLSQDSAVTFIASPTALQADPAGFSARPVGAGPFEMTEFVVDDHITYEKYEDYWHPDRPYLERMDFRAAPDVQTNQQAMLAGDIDVAQTNVEFTKQEQENPELEFHAFELPSAYMLAFNTRKAPGNDVRVRQAVAMAFNPESTNNVVYGGLWDEYWACPPFRESSPQCLEGVWPEYDLDEAKELLQEYAAEGNSLDLKLVELPSPPVTTYMQSVLTELGFNLQVVDQAFSAVVADQRAGNFDITQVAISPFIDPYPKLFDIMYSKARNVPLHADADLDRALEEARDADTAEDRAEGWKTVQEVNAEQQYVIFMGPYSQFATNRSTIDMGPDYHGNLTWFWDQVKVTG